MVRKQMIWQILWKPKSAQALEKKRVKNCTFCTNRQRVRKRLTGKHLRQEDEAKNEKAAEPLPQNVSIELPTVEHRTETDRVKEKRGT
jgi:hypothetical protein